ncbi:MAG: YihY family inner membrane protein [Pseudomonadota bacterium]
MNLDVHQLGRVLLDRARYLLYRFKADRCRDTAAALTYVSLFALVPLLTVLYTMASAVPAFQGMEANIQDLLFENLVPESSAGLEQYLNDYSRQARQLSGFGVAFLFATAILMLSNIEQAFNRIWRTRKNRGAISSVLLYWAVLSLAPLTIGFGVAASTYLASFAHHLERWDSIGVGALLLRITPYVLEILGFTLVYAAVPNCRVPLRHALVGGILAAVSFNLARALFTKLVAGSSITFIYGAFAAVPLFLLWLYISWTIVLVAAIFVHSLSAYQSEAQLQRPLLIKGLEALELLWRKQQDGRPVTELEIVSRRGAAIDPDSWRVLRDRLLEHRVVAQDDEGSYMLSRDLHSVPVWHLREMLDDDSVIPSANEISHPPWKEKAKKMLEKRREDDRETYSLSLAELFQS